jgi:NH3-dependent NAD+ synthetase
LLWQLNGEWQMKPDLNASFTINGTNGPRTSLRGVPVEALFDQAVSWVADVVKREEAPGLIVGISGTDSILSYIVCLEAFKRLGKPLTNVRGVNFQHKTQDHFVEMDKPFVCMQSEDTEWVAREIFPWLKSLYPEARLEVDASIPHSKDGARWGNIHDKAKEEVNGRGDLVGTYYFPVGTRNATENAIGGYTLITSAVSLFPIKHIYKTEVVDLCRHLGVPEIAIEKSQEIDCDCGRFEVQAHNMRELDMFIMAKRGLIDKSRLDTIDSETLRNVRAFYFEEHAINEFKERTPYSQPDEAAEARTPAAPQP